MTSNETDNSGTDLVTPTAIVVSCGLLVVGAVGLAMAFKEAAECKAAIEENTEAVLQIKESWEVIHDTAAENGFEVKSQPLKLNFDDLECGV